MKPHPSMLLGAASGPVSAWDSTKISGNGAVGPAVLFGCNNAGQGSVIGTKGRRTGKAYWELLVQTPGYSSIASDYVAHCAIAITPAASLYFGGSGKGVQLTDDGRLVSIDTFGTITGYMSAFTSSIQGALAQVRLQCAVDFGARLVWFGLNNTFVGNPAAGTGGAPILSTTYYPAVSFPWAGGASGSPWFGGEFYGEGFFEVGGQAYTAPAGFSPQW
jgi:hypothetical protein